MIIITAVHIRNNCIVKMGHNIKNEQEGLNLIREWMYEKAYCMNDKEEKFFREYHYMLRHTSEDDESFSLHFEHIQTIDDLH